MKITEKQLSPKEKNRIRWRTIRYLERYCEIEKKCQICGTLENIQIHHPNYNDYLKINLLCRKHHYEVHNNLIQAPKTINLVEKSNKNSNKDKNKKTYKKKQAKSVKLKWYESSKWNDLPNKEIVLKRLLQENNMLSDMNIKRVDTEKKRKAIFYLGTKGKDLSTAVREMLDKYAKEYDQMQKK